MESKEIEKSNPNDKLQKISEQYKSNVVNMTISIIDSNKLYKYYKIERNKVEFCKLFEDLCNIINSSGIRPELQVLTNPYNMIGLGKSVKIITGTTNGLLGINKIYAPYEYILYDYETDPKCIIL